MKIIIGADLVPTVSNAELFQKGDATALAGEELFKVLQSADYRIFNLEVPLTDQVTPIAKCGPALIAGTDTVAGYKALGVDLVTLANNHILDQGEQGLSSTVKTLDSYGIAHVGASDCLLMAKRPFVVEWEGQKVGIYACAEHESTIAQETLPGANPFDPLETPDHVAALKAQCDYVIILYHGGKEHYRYPSPNLQKVCRKLVEKGADLVVCQHSHCVGCEEKYLNGTIVYGQGNFLFDDSESDFWQTSLLIHLDDHFKVSYIPLVKAGNGVRLADKAQSEAIMSNFYARSEEIREPAKVKGNYIAHAKKMRDWYLTQFSGINTGSFFYRAAYKLTGGKLQSWCIKCRYKPSKYKVIQNFLECEAHHELFLTGIKES